MRVLLTGFEPFGSLDTNVSWEVAKRVAEMSLGAVDLAIEQMPVSFGRVAEVLRDAVGRHNPDIILSLGQSGSGDSVKLERVALNMMDSKMCDNDGYQPNEEPIDRDGDAALFTSLPIKLFRSAIEAKGINSVISNSAGLYVCNRLYYEALRLERERPGQRALFIHLPYYTGQRGVAVDKRTMPLASLTDAVITIIQTLYDDFNL
ncbi:MAG: pyroglutamyl-peptidase I [Alistipes sp.]|nr:pyroglutamyl-peptidase I [Alistipes sp.]MBR3892228.1 pyroglutamyl-peptidase I [Alistipes sp.]